MDKELPARAMLLGVSNSNVILTSGLLGVAFNNLGNNSIIDIRRHHDLVMLDNISRYSGTTHPKVIAGITSTEMIANMGSGVHIIKTHHQARSLGNMLLRLRHRPTYYIKTRTR